MSTTGSVSRWVRAVMAWAVLLAVSAPAGHAATGPTTGWWTTAPVAAAPDAPADGLVVQGGQAADEPIAYAAVSYQLDADERPQSLVLDVAEGSASTPAATLRLCLLTEAFAPAQGRPMADAPGFDCVTSVDAPPSDDGASYTFDVGSLARSASLAVAVLPTALTDRVVLAPPGAGALQSDGPDRTTFEPSPSSGAGLSSSDLSAPPTGGAFQTGDLGPTAPSAGAPAPAAAASPSEAGTAPPESAARPVSTSESTSPLPAIALVALLLMAGTLWWSAGAPARPASPATA